jgi:hypothetical protein
MPKPIPIVFICAPYTARCGRDIAFNIRLARDYARQLAANELGFICPHTNSANMHDIGEPEYWYEMYLTILEQCDAMLVVGKWERSTGCQKEIYRAQKLSIPTFYNLSELYQWSGILRPITPSCSIKRSRTTRRNTNTKKSAI